MNTTGDLLISVFVLYSFKAVFDIVNYNMKLENTNCIKRIALQWFDKCLSDRLQSGESSSDTKVSHVVPRGFLLDSDILCYTYFP